MDSISFHKEKSEVSVSINIFLILLAIFMHQSNVIFGVNISFSDFFCLLLLILLSTKKQLLIPKKQLVFITMLFSYSLITSLYYIPSRFDYIIQYKSIIVNLMKNLVLFAYFILGYNIVILNKNRLLFKWYALSGVVIALVGVIFTILNINFFKDILYFQGVRFRGLMNDPNYFGILQVTTLVILFKITNPRIRNSLCLIVILAIFASGSKTALITLLLFSLLILSAKVFHSQFKKKNVILGVLTFLLVIIMSFQIDLNSMVAMISQKIPAFSRVLNIFIDFDSALEGSGSSRGTTWKYAFELIKISPVFGLGIGTYSVLAVKLFGEGIMTIAHNTYLQVAVEYGLPMTIFLFVYIIQNIIMTKNINSYKIDGKILGEILLVLLLGSFSVSFNNSRILWLVLGMLISVNKGNLKNDYL